MDRPTDSPPNIFRRSLARLQIPGLTLRRTWLFSQILFVVCMLSTSVIFTYQAAMVIAALVGICWSLTLWAPFALISAEISQRDEARRLRERQKLSDPNGDWNQQREEETDQAGIILGLHNVAVSAPQILSTMICSAIFKALQKPRNEPGDTSVGWALRFGGAATLIAVWLTYRMREPGEPGQRT